MGKPYLLVLLVFPMEVQVVVYRDPLDPEWILAEAICCGELVVDQGKSVEEAVSALREALLLLMEEKGLKEGLTLKVHEKVSIAPRRARRAHLV